MARNRGGGSFRAFMIGMVVGLAAGGIVALLYTPRRGADLRSAITGTVIGTRERAAGLIDRACDAMTELRDRFERKAEEFERKAEESTPV